jgi:hypothetical protein
MGVVSRLGGWLLCAGWEDGCGEQDERMGGGMCLQYPDWDWTGQFTNHQATDQSVVYGC